jgi:hypothetical protein
MHVRVNNNGKHGSRWQLARVTPTPTPRHASATSDRNAMPSTATNPNEPGNIGKLLVHRWVQRQKSSARSEDSSIAVLLKLGSGCQHCRRTMGGRRDGCCGSVQRAQWVFETRLAGWSMGMIKALLGTREWIWDGKLES